MQDFRKFFGGPVGQFAFFVVALYFALAAIFGAPITISLFDAATVGVGLVFCGYVAVKVWENLLAERPERAALWAIGGSFIIASTVVIRTMRIAWTGLDLPWLSEHLIFGLATATQWTGFVLCLAALVAPDNGTIFKGTRRPLVLAAIFTAIMAAVIIWVRFAR